MNEEIQQEEVKEKTETWIIVLGLIFGPLILGTAGRIIIYLWEHLDEIMGFIDSIRISILNYCHYLMETNFLMYLLITAVSNWVFGGILIVFLGIIVFGAD